MAACRWVKASTERSRSRPISTVASTTLRANDSLSDCRARRYTLTAKSAAATTTAGTAMKLASVLARPTSAAISPRKT